MSKISLKPNASGTSNVDRTLNLPDEAGTVLTNVSDIESQVKTATNATGTAPVYACRAWVNFQGNGTVSIRESGNVSSITDNGTGQHTVNFTTAMPDNDYCAQGTSGGGVNDAQDNPDNASMMDYRIGSVDLTTRAASNTVRDSFNCSVAIFR
jgi:hypothetical protein